MHLIYLGVVKKLIVAFWCNGKPPSKLSYNQIHQISEKLNVLRKDIPGEFNRKPRSLLDSKRWKATEFRQFLFYSGPVVLKCLLSSDMYQNFMTLHVSLTILSNAKLQNSLINYAEELLIYFVKTFMILYGKHSMSHNVHNLLHLCSESKKFGVLEDFSAFPFENYMQELLKCIRKNEAPLKQIVLRKFEIDKNLPFNNNSSVIYPQFFKEHSKGPTLNIVGQQFEKLSFAGFSLQVSRPDNCCRLKNGDVILIKNFVILAEGNYVIGSKFNKLLNFYTQPCPSSVLFTYLVDINDVSLLEKWDVLLIDFKFVMLTLRENKHVIIPLLHSET